MQCSKSCVYGDVPNGVSIVTVNNTSPWCFFSSFTWPESNSPGPADSTVARAHGAHGRADGRLPGADRDSDGRTDGRLGPGGRPADHDGGPAEHSEALSRPRPDSNLNARPHCQSRAARRGRRPGLPVGRSDRRTSEWLGRAGPHGCSKAPATSLEESALGGRPCHEMELQGLTLTT
jgi:hypothetical protein